MPLNNITGIMFSVSDFIKYNGRVPNVLIIGYKLQKEMDNARSEITLLSELERIKCLTNIDGTKIFKIVAFTDDIEGFMVMYNTIR